MNFRERLAQAFNSKLRRITAGLSLGTAFAFSHNAGAQARDSLSVAAPDNTRAAAAVRGAEPDPYSYWKYQDVDAVIRLKTCDPPRGLCAEIHAINPDDPKAQKMAAALLGKPLPPENILFEATYDPGDIFSMPSPYLTRQDVLSLCGGQMDITVRKEGKSWKGRIKLPNKARKYGIILDIPSNAGNLKIAFYDPRFSPIQKNTHLTPVETPPEVCSVKPATPVVPGP